MTHYIGRLLRTTHRRTYALLSSVLRIFSHFSPHIKKTFLPAVLARKISMLEEWNLSWVTELFFRFHFMMISPVVMSCVLGTCMGDVIKAFFYWIEIPFLIVVITLGDSIWMKIGQAVRSETFDCTKRVKLLLNVSLSYCTCSKAEFFWTSWNIFLK